MGPLCDIDALKLVVGKFCPRVAGQDALQIERPGHEQLLQDRTITLLIHSLWALCLVSAWLAGCSFSSSHRARGYERWMQQGSLEDCLPLSTGMAFALPQWRR